jgi:radical SAM protein (TIGR04043 family)
MTPREVTLLKIQLLCRGVKGLIESRRGGAGPTGGCYLIFPNGIIGDIPVRGKFISSSPFLLEKEDGENWVWKDGGKICSVRIVERPGFYDKFTSSGIPMVKIARLHGKDTIGITVDRYCRFQHEKIGCKYCSIYSNVPEHQGISLARKEYEWVAEVVLEAYREGKCRGVTLTSGYPENEEENAILYSRIAESIKGIDSKISIHAQISPPENLRLLDSLSSSGIDSIGIHIDVFHQQVMRRIVPGKFRLGKSRYISAWKYAIDAFGENQVSTFLLVGLGEGLESVRKACEMISSIGVIPYVLPHRPLPETPLAELPPPRPSYLLSALLHARDSMNTYGIKIFRSKGGCMRCGACSALHDVIRFSR